MCSRIIKEAGEATVERTSANILKEGLEVSAEKDRLQIRWSIWNFL